MVKRLRSVPAASKRKRTTLAVSFPSFPASALMHDGMPYPPTLSTAGGFGPDGKLEFSLSREQTNRPTVNDKIADPKRYPTLTIQEVRTLFHNVSRSTVYRWLDSGKLERASLGRAACKRGMVRILTRSVLKSVEPDPN